MVFDPNEEFMWCYFVVLQGHTNMFTTLFFNVVKKRSVRKSKILTHRKTWWFTDFWFDPI